MHQLLREALSDNGATIIVKRDVSEAVEAICAHRFELGLDLLVIDFDEGCHGMTLLSTVTICRRDFPTIVVTSSDRYHGAAFASAHNVAACLAKPITAAELRMVLTELGAAKSLLA